MSSVTRMHETEPTASLGRRPRSSDRGNREVGIKCLVTVALWGERYVRRFVDISLPTQLSDGNLGALNPGSGSSYLIVTTEEDRKRIEDAPAYLALTRKIETGFLTMSPPRRGDKYFGVSRFQNAAVQRSYGYDAVFFVYPDFVLADGVFRTALRRLDEGALAVTLPVPRVLEESFVPRFLARTGGEAGGGSGNVRTLRPRELVELANECLHPTMATFYWDGEEIARFPSSLLWEAPDGGLLMRCFHTHPLALRVQERNPAYADVFRISLDEEYLPRVIRTAGDVYCVPDSDEGAICSLSDSDFRLATAHKAGRPPVRHVALWAERHAAVLHREFLRRPYRWHGAEVDETAWAEVERRSDSNIDFVLDRLKIPDRVLRYEDPEAFRARTERAKLYRYWIRPGALSLATKRYDTWTLLFLLAARILVVFLRAVKKRRRISAVADLLLARLRGDARFRKTKRRIREVVEHHAQEPTFLIVLALLKRLAQSNRN